MRVIKKSEVRKIIIGHVELTLIFLFDYLLCKIAILESLKVLFLDKKQKLLSVDGIYKNRCAIFIYVCVCAQVVACGQTILPQPPGYPATLLPCSGKQGSRPLLVPMA